MLFLWLVFRAHTLWLKKLIGGLLQVEFKITFEEQKIYRPLEELIQKVNSPNFQVVVLAMKNAVHGTAQAAMTRLRNPCFGTRTIGRRTRLKSSK
jgi:hypothetical protein